MKRAIVFSLVFVFAGCAASPLPPEPTDTFIAALEDGDRRLAAGDASGAVDAFSRAIDLEPKSALAFLRRAEARRAAGDEEDAWRDYATAIDLNLQDSLPWFRRGKARQESGDYSGAIQDYSHALDIRTREEYFRARGHSRFCLGLLEDAWCDLDSATRLQGTGSAREYTELEIAAVLMAWKNRAEATSRLKFFVTHSSASVECAWPRQIASLILGDLSEADLLLTARSAEGATRRERLCEAFFYAGMARFVAGEEDKAAELLRDCVDNAVPGFVEPPIAKAMLKRLER